MSYICHMIKGVPYCRNKTRGDTNAPARWTESVAEQTKDLPKITSPCLMKVTFFLPANKFPSDLPHGPDLDNLLKRFMDALKKTVFSEAEGCDSCVVAITATKTKVGSDSEAGAHLEILPFDVM